MLSSYAFTRWQKSSIVIMSSSLITDLSAPISQFGICIWWKWRKCFLTYMMDWTVDRYLNSLAKTVHLPFSANYRPTVSVCFRDSLDQQENCIKLLQSTHVTSQVTSTLADAGQPMPLTIYSWSCSVEKLILIILGKTKCFAIWLEIYNTWNWMG